MTNVLKLLPSRYGIGDPDPAVVSVARRVLECAERGELVSIAVCAVTVARVGTDWRYIGPDQDGLALVGAVEILKAVLVADLNATRSNVDVPNKDDSA